MSLLRPARLCSGWRWFPLALTGTLVVVFAVNAFMVFTALTTFPGEAGQDGFDLSNGYGRVLEATAHRSALGWQIGVDAGPDRRARLRVTDRAGAPLSDMSAEARAERPLGPKQETRLLLASHGAGRLVSTQTLQPGRWTVFVTVTQRGETVSATGQLTIP